MLKRKKVTQHLGCFGDQHGAARGICNVYEFTRYLSLSLFHYQYPSQTFKDLVSQLQFSVYIELFYIIVLKNRLNLLINLIFSLRSANYVKVVIKLCQYWGFTSLNMFTQMCIGIKCPKTIQYDYNSYSTFYLWSALQTLTNEIVQVPYMFKYYNYAEVSDLLKAMQPSRG